MAGKMWLDDWLVIAAAVRSHYTISLHHLILHSSVFVGSGK